MTALSAGELESVRRILFVRSDRIGDAIVSTPALQALRVRCPQAEIDIVLGRKNAEAAPLLPFVDRVFVVDHGFAIARCLGAMRLRRYDVAINALRSPSTTATLLTKLSGARVTIGCAPGKESPYDITLRQPDEPTHFVKRYLLPLTALGIAMPDDHAIRLSIKVTDQAREAAQMLIGSRARRLAMINISCSSAAKFWGVERYAQLARDLMALDLDVIIVAAPGDDALQQAIASQSGARPIPPAASLMDFAGVIGSADLLVSPDTATVHIAAALGKPVVALEPTERNVVEWHPWGVPHRAVSAGEGIADIPYDDVVGAARSLAAEIF